MKEETIKYKAEINNNKKMLSDWMVVKEGPSTKTIIAWIPRWHPNSAEIANRVAQALNERGIILSHL